jgi:hypothetical protein
MIKKLLLLILCFTVTLSFCLTSIAAIFTKVTKEAGLENAPSKSSAIVWGDYDNDGDLDLYLGVGSWGAWEPGPDVFYRNNGDGTLTDITKEVGLNKNIGACPHAGFFDYDEDGFIDLYLFNDDRVLIYHNEKGKNFTDVSEKLGMKPLQDFSWSGGYADFDNDGNIDLYIALYNLDLMYKGNGKGSFTNVSDKANLGQKNTGVNTVFGDYDNDGDMDIFMANGFFFGENAILYRNDGDFTFTDVTKESGISCGGHSAAFFDYDNDGDLDIYIVDGISSSVLYRNEGNKTFTNVAWDSGAFLPEGERLTVGDYDNDGYMDIFAMQWSGGVHLFHNNSDGTFTDVARESGLTGWFSAANGCAFADYDNDGDLDLYASGSGNMVFYKNEGNGNNWLNIKLIGTTSNKDAIGARVVVNAGDLSMMREINPGCARGNIVPMAYFGLGKNSVANSVEIKWPSGRIQTMKDVPANQIIIFSEAQGLIQGKSVTSQGKLIVTWGKVKDKLYQNYPNPFNPETWIPYQLENDADVEIKIYSAEGRLVRTLNLGRKQAGSYINQNSSAHWNGKDESGEQVSSGVYFYVLKAGDFTANRKMIILR